MSKRFKADRAERIAQYLRLSGIDEQAETGAASTALHGGCADAECCTQHSDVSGMLEVKTVVSGSKLHKIAEHVDKIHALLEKSQWRYAKEECYEIAVVEASKAIKGMAYFLPTYNCTGMVVWGGLHCYRNTPKKTSKVVCWETILSH